MKFELRPYQKEAVEAGVRHLTGRSRKPGVLVAPVACGKSLIIGQIAKEINAPTLVLQPSKEILMQNYDKAVSFGLEPTIYSASCKKKELSTLTYATIGSVKKEVDNLKHLGIKILLMDECHLKYSPDPDSEFMTFVKEFPEIRTLGLTATPCRLHSYSSLAAGNYSMLNMLTKDIPRYFEKMVHVIQIKDIIANGFWAKMQYEVWDFDESDLILNSSGAEYTEDSIKRSIAKNGVNNTIYKRIRMLLNERKHILVCMDSVENAYILSNFLNNKLGYMSDVVEGATPKKKREKILEDFKAGKVRVVFNHSTLTTGFDFPELDCVIFGRPTFSYSIYYQIIGRGLRLHKDKENCLFIDCCNNYKRFGRVEDLSIEDFPGRGWSMFSGDHLISNIPMGSVVTKQDLWARYNARKAIDSPIEIERRPENRDTMIMPFGMYKGKPLKEVPLSYIKWFVETAEDSRYLDMMTDYYKSLIL